MPPEDSASALDSTSLSSSTIEINVVAGDDDALADANEKLLAALDGVEGAKSITSNLDAAQPAVQVTVNRDAVSAVGLTENDVVGLISAQMV